VGLATEVNKTVKSIKLSLSRAYARGGGSPLLNLLCYKNVITYAKEFVYVFVHFCWFDVNLTQKPQNDFA